MTAAKRALRDADITAVAWLSAPTLDPDGRRAAVVETRLSEATGQLESQLLIVDVDGARVDGSPVTQVAAWPSRWDRDGRRIAVARDVDGTIGPWLIQPAEGEVAPLASELPPAIQTGPASWSADAEWLAFPARDPGNGHAHLRIVHVASGRAVEHSEPNAAVRSCAWSPTGHRIATVVDDGGPQGASLWVSDVDTGARSCIASPLGSISSPVWSPDGDELAYIATESLADQAANHILEVVPAVGGGRRRVGGNLDVSFGQRVQSDDPRGYDEPTLCWPTGARGLLTTYSVGGSTRLAWIGTGGCEEIVASQEVVLDFDCTADGETIAFISSDPSTPGELHVIDASGRRRVTDRNEEWLSQVRLAEVSGRLVSSSDVEIEAWIYRPVAAEPAKPGPAILAIHGGPHWPAGWRFSFEYQRHAANGRTVVISNPRGSQGYGAAFARANQGDWGGCDADDIEAVAGFAKRLDGVDPDLVAVTGVSYGGYLACLLAARSDHFHAVVGENLLTDLARYVQESGDADLAAVEFGGLPDDRPRFYSDRSPVTHAKTLKAPVLLVHGELDDDCPIDHSELLLEALEDEDGDVSLVRIPGEGHAMVIEGSLDHRLLRWGELDRFLDTHLSPAGAGSGNPPPQGSE